MDSFDEFKHLWTNNQTRNRIKYSHLIFIVVYPDKLEWDFGVEKQTQTTCLQISGGMTGAGTGHDVKLMYQSELHDFLKTCTQTHAMITTVGMVFELTATKTPIMEFHDFSKSDKFCKAHIMAKPNQPAWLHHQHIELNINMWKELGCPNLFTKKIWEDYTRSKQNYHDDYTPFWLDPKGLPRIHNFTANERRNKAFSYGHMKERREIHNQTWSKIKLGKLDEVDREDNYFSRFMTRMRETYYITNNEGSSAFPDCKFDLIITPTAGYTGEILSDGLDFDGEVIFYDYTKQNIDIKRTIVEMNMSSTDLKYYVKQSKASFDTGLSWDKIDSLVETQSRMLEKYDIDYWVMNLIKPDYDKLLEKVEGKKVYFNASNIFSYHMSHAVYTLDELISSYDKLHHILSRAKSYYFRGTNPNKRWEYINK